MKRAKSEHTVSEYDKKIKYAEGKIGKYVAEEKRTARDTSDSEDDCDVAIPFKLEDVDEKLFQKYFEDQAKHSNGQWKAASTVDGYRSALLHYFTSRHLPVPSILQGDILLFVKGLKRTIADARRDGTYKETEGMDCLDFVAFSLVCRLTAASNHFDAHAFLLLTWNLICRADTTTHLIYSCISWSNDALRVDIPKSKGLQLGADRGLAHQESVYANPVQPEMCAITALGIKVLCTTLLPTNGGLYRTSDQSNYSLGQILPKYIQQMLRGDQSVGRTVSGLDPNSSNFGLLPPRFATLVGVNFAEMVSDYNAYPASFKSVIPYLLASVIYHREWVTRTLPKTHDVFNSRFWRCGWPARLAEKVLDPCPLTCTITNMRATGVSCLTTIMCRMDTMQEAMGSPSARTGQQTTEEVVVAAVNSAVSQLKDVIALALQSAAPVPTANPEPDAMQLPQAVTKDFAWPSKSTTKEMYDMWYHGKSPFGPFRHIHTKSLNPKAQKARTMAHKTVQVINSFIPDLVHDMPATDDQFRAGCVAMCQTLVERRIKEAESNGKQSSVTVDSLMDKVVRNAYTSMYENEMKFLRK